MRKAARYGTLLSVLSIETLLGGFARPAIADIKKPITVALVDAQKGDARGSSSITLSASALAVTAPKLPKSGSYQAFYLSNPPRIVIDLIGVKSPRNENHPVDGHPAIRSVRVGAHADKVRIVADLKEERESTLQVVNVPQGVRIDLAEGSTSEPTASTPTPTKMPQVQPTPPKKSAATLPPTATNTPALIETSTPTSTPTPPATKEPAIRAAVTPRSEPSTVPTQTPASTVTRQQTPIPPTQTGYAPTPQPTLAVTFKKGGSALAGEVPPINELIAGRQGTIFTGYSFEYLAPGRTPILKVKMNRPRFQARFSKVDAKTYKVTIPQAIIIGPHVTLPQFPPADFSGFVMVTAQQVAGAEKSVEISIFIEEGVTLGSFVREDEIVIKRM